MSDMYSNLSEPAVTQEHFDALSEEVRQVRLVNESTTADNNRLRERLSQLEQENAAMHAEKSQLHSEMSAASAYIQELE